MKEGGFFFELLIYGYTIGIVLFYGIVTFDLLPTENVYLRVLLYTSFIRLACIYLSVHGYATVKSYVISQAISLLTLITLLHSIVIFCFLMVDKNSNTLVHPIIGSISVDQRRCCVYYDKDPDCNGLGPCIPNLSVNDLELRPRFWIMLGLTLWFMFCEFLIFISSYTEFINNKSFMIQAKLSYLRSGRYSEYQEDSFSSRFGSTLVEFFDNLVDYYDEFGYNITESGSPIENCEGQGCIDYDDNDDVDDNNGNYSPNYEVDGYGRDYNDEVYAEEEEYGEEEEERNRNINESSQLYMSRTNANYKPRYKNLQGVNGIPIRRSNVKGDKSKFNGGYRQRHNNKSLKKTKKIMCKWRDIQQEIKRLEVDENKSIIKQRMKDTDGRIDTSIKGRFMKLFNHTTNLSFMSASEYFNRLSTELSDQKQSIYEDHTSTSEKLQKKLIREQKQVADKIKHLERNLKQKPNEREDEINQTHVQVEIKPTNQDLVRCRRVGVNPNGHIKNTEFGVDVSHREINQPGMVKRTSNTSRHTSKLTDTPKNSRPNGRQIKYNHIQQPQQQQGRGLETTTDEHSRKYHDMDERDKFSSECRAMGLNDTEFNDTKKAQEFTEQFSKAFATPQKNNNNDDGDDDDGK